MKPLNTKLYRKNSNTSDAIIEFLDYFYSSLYSKQSTIAVYLDFSKPFRHSHNILMSTLLPNVVRDIMQCWLESYLSITTNNMSQSKTAVPLLYVKHYIGCSTSIGIGPSTFFFENNLNNIFYL